MIARLAGRIALITGGGGGIGAATGELFCRHGAKVVLVDQNMSALNKARSQIGERVAAAELEVVECDVTDTSDVARAVLQTTERFGALNVLVNNAAIRYVAPVAAADTDQWTQLMQVNLVGAVNFCKAAVAELRKGGRSSVINVSSCYAARGRKSFGAYDATKAALLSLTRTLAWEEAEHGVRVNAVCPGGTLTPFTVGRGIARGGSEEQMRKETKPDALLGRWAEASEIAYPILWLASEEASFVTGATLMVDGGCSIM
jgi:meso-butanediol dehydrogenase/(S,S)-butanediol dehydrogenase/diacetyl reductase